MLRVLHGFFMFENAYIREVGNTFFFKLVTHTCSYLVYLSFDEEQFYECRRALDCCVDMFQRQGLLANHVVVLREEVLHPKQRRGRLLLSVICKNPYQHKND